MRIRKSSWEGQIYSWSKPSSATDFGSTWARLEMSVFAALGAKFVGTPQDGIAQYMPQVPVSASEGR
jgi:hypothetical protein